MCLEHDLGREGVEEREIWDEDNEGDRVEEGFVSMVGESSFRRSNKIIQITNDTTSTGSVALIPPPLLKIPTTSQRILQTDASDDFWSAIILEKIGDSESITLTQVDSLKIQKRIIMLSTRKSL